MTDPKPKFNIGDRVTAVAMPNAIPAPREAVTGMVIVARRLVYPSSARDTLAPYWQYAAFEAADPSHRIEGAEPFFEADEEGGAQCV